MKPKPRVDTWWTGHAPKEASEGCAMPRDWFGNQWKSLNHAARAIPAYPEPRYDTERLKPGKKNVTEFRTKYQNRDQFHVYAPALAANDVVAELGLATLRRSLVEKIAAVAGEAKEPYKYKRLTAVCSRNRVRSCPGTRSRGCRRRWDGVSKGRKSVQAPMYRHPWMLQRVFRSLVRSPYGPVQRK
ncbi:hypothetical protein ZHAS_00016532 [Anopheles sinensis]|uniref:Uncharacterized protein n=1 Tax=Anopheles sinensis TaxID=74873 RepID=A0A084WDW4_ANOSI|nr:hypothetical protein ZHAS_00016532 [Anopheles sinensis]